MKITLEHPEYNERSAKEICMLRPGVYKQLCKCGTGGYVISTKNNIYWIDLINNNIEPFDEEALRDSKFTLVEQLTLTFRS